jgi:hypothetical protein
VAYFTSYYTNYFDVGEAPPVVVERPFAGGGGIGYRQQRAFDKLRARDKRDLREQLEKLLFPVPEIEIPGRVIPAEVKARPQQIDTIRKVARRFNVKPLYIPDAEPELRRIFRAAVKRVIAERQAIEKKKKRRKRDEEALLLWLG